MRTKRGFEEVQKYFVAYEVKETGGVSSFGFTFARKKGEARKRAEHKANANGSGGRRNVVAVWVCELMDLKDELRQILGVSTSSGIPAVIRSMLSNTRITYEIEAKNEKASKKPKIVVPTASKPRIRVKPTDILALPAPVKVETKTEEAVEWVHTPYVLLSADSYQRPKE